MQKYLETIQQLLNKIDQDYKPAFLENIFPALLQIKQTKITETKQNIKYREKELLTIAKLKNPRDIIRYTKEKNNTGKSEIKLTAQDITTYTEEIIKQLKIINTDIREEYIIIFSKILYKLPSIKIINELTKKIESIDKDKRIDFILLFSIILEMDLKSKTNTEKKELLENIKLQDKYNYSKIIQKIIEQ